MEMNKKMKQIESAVFKIYVKLKEIRKEFESEISDGKKKKPILVLINGEKKD